MAAEDSAAQTAAPPHEAPVVIERKKKKKKKKYSKGMKEAQRMERRMSNASQHLADAVADGLSTYRKQRDKSARKKRDGAVKDFIPNAAKGVSKSMRVASKAPTELAKVVNTKRVRRQIRGVIRLMQPFR